MKTVLKIFSKKADFSDIEFLWFLRNQSDVYKYSRKNRAVSWKEHIEWVLPVILGIAPKDIFIIKNLRIPVGQIRFDYKGKNEANVSISVLKKFRGKGFAKKAFKKVIKKFKTQKTKKLIAEIHKNNLNSIKFFEKLDFKFRIRKGNWLQYILKLEKDNYEK